MAATRKLDQSKLMLEAGQQGNAAVQSAHNTRTSNIQQSANRAENQRQFNEQVDQQELDRWQRQWEEKRANELRERQLDEQTRQFDVSTGERARQFDESQALTAADRGLERVGGAVQQPAEGQQQRIGQQPAMGTQGDMDPRLAALRAEMGRAGAQINQGLEIGSQGRGYVKSAARQQSEAGAEQRAQQDSESRRVQAVAQYQRAVNDYRIAEMRANSAASASVRTAETAALKELKTQLMQPIKSTVKTMDRMMSGKGTMQDWQSVNAELANSPDAGRLTGLKAEAAGGVWTDGLQSFMQQKVVVQSLKFINATGELPDGELVDMSSPGMQAFTAAAKDVSIMNSPTMPGPGQLLSFQDQAARIRYINRQAAWFVLNQKPTSEEGGQLNPAAPGAGYQSHEQRAGPEGQVPPGGQITSEEAQRRAAQPSPVLEDVQLPEDNRPTAGEEGYVQPQSSRGAQPDWAKVK